MNHEERIRYFQHEIEVLAAPSPKFTLPTSRLIRAQQIKSSIDLALRQHTLTESEAIGLHSLNDPIIANFQQQVNN